MVKDDFWSEPADNLNDVVALTNQENISVFEHKADVSQRFQLAASEDTISSPQPPVIPTTSFSAPIIYEDIWGDSIDEPTVTESPSFPNQKLRDDIETIKEYAEDEELLDKRDDDEKLFPSENSDEISDSAIASSFASYENTPDLLTEFEDFSTFSAAEDVLEHDLLLDNLELLDIDAVLAELKEEELSPSQTKRQTEGVVIGQGNVQGWMGSYGLFYINWEYGAEAEQEALKRLGYAELEISEATRAFIIQAARAARLPRRQEREMTTKLEHARLLLAQLPRCNDPENDPYAEQRAALNAEIADLERTLVSKMQWVAVKKATQFVGRGIDLDDLIQFGMLGVIAGVKHYDVNRNARLLVAVNLWVFQSLNRAVSEFARLVRVPVYISEILTNMKKQYEALQMSLSRFPTQKELADACHISIKRLEELLCLDRKSASLDACRTIEYAHEGYSFQAIEEKLVIGEDVLNDEMDQLDMKQAAEAMLRCLSAREKQVINLLYGLDDDEGERTLEEVGKILCVTRERIRQIEDRALEKIRRKYGIQIKKVVETKKTPQKTKRATSSQYQSTQRKIVKTNPSKSLPKIGDAKSQRSIQKTEEYGLEKITFRHGFILRRVPESGVSESRVADNKLKHHKRE